MGESFSKKENSKKKAKQKQEKQEKMKDRKTNNLKGKPFEEMMAYIDENGQISSVPPNPKEKGAVSYDPRIFAGTPKTEEVPRTGTVTFFNHAKGYGFITDNKTREEFFVHTNQLSEIINEKDKVTFEIARTPRGMSAVRVIKNK